MATEVQSRSKTCKSYYKDSTGTKLKCGTGIPAGSSECPERKRHILPFKTGACSSGFHEGTRARDAAGKPAKVCELWQTCPCECHENLDELFSMTKQERYPQANPEYSPPRNPYWVPSPEELLAMRAESADARKPKFTIVKSSKPGILPDKIVRNYEPTPTGRSARGELASLVRECVDQWVEMASEIFECTPKYVASWIERTKGDGKVQSAGAVSFVFKSWEDVGFAVLGQKPARFIRYTDEGLKLGYEAMKLRAKSEKKRRTSLADRGIRGG